LIEPQSVVRCRIANLAIRLPKQQAGNEHAENAIRHPHRFGHRLFPSNKRYVC